MTLRFSHALAVLALALLATPIPAQAQQSTLRSELTHGRVANLATAVAEAGHAPGLAEAAAAALTENDRITAPDAAEGDAFGYRVALSGNRAVIAARGDDTNAGSAYVFTFDATQPVGSQWTLQAKLTASDASEGAQFGGDVALIGDRALIGAPGAGVAFDRPGSAYVFAFDGSQPAGLQWTQEAKLTADDGAGRDSFGYSVSLSGNRALIGARSDRSDDFTSSGSAYVFVLDGSAWIQKEKLTANNATSGFGWAVALSDNRALVGAIGDQGEGEGCTRFSPCGAAYVFALDGSQPTGSQWSQQAKLTASDAAGGDRFGFSVALLGDRALIGAPPSSGAGSAYVFAFDDSQPVGSQWAQQAKLIADDGSVNDNLGWSAALSDDRAIVGAIGDRNNSSSIGSAYVFAFDVAQPVGAQWSQLAKLTASAAAEGAFVGVDVALEGDRALVGAVSDVVAGLSSGSAFTFSLSPHLDPIACAVGTGLTFVDREDFDTDGDPEVVPIGNLSSVPVSAEGCSVAFFDPFTEQVTVSSLLPSVVVPPGAQNSVLSVNSGGGDLVPNGPGAIVFVEGTVAVGASVADVLPKLVTGMVYRSETDVLGIYSSFAKSATSTEAFLAALASLTQPVASEDAAADAYTLTVAPNPVAGRGTVTFELAEAANVRVALYDALGREVAQLADGPYGAGRHTVALATASLPTGVYVARAQLGDTARTVRLTVVR